jgi:hypothetical protein
MRLPQQDVMTRLRECGLDWSLELMDGGEVGHYHAKRLGLIHTAKDLSTNSLQFIRNLVGQWEYEGSIDSLKRNVQPRTVMKRQNLRLSSLGFEIHDDVLCEGVFVADFEYGKELVEMSLGEFGIDGEPDLSALLCGSNDSALRSGASVGCCLLWRGHLSSLL